MNHSPDIQFTSAAEICIATHCAQVQYVSVANQLQVATINDQTYPMGSLLYNTQNVCIILKINPVLYSSLEIFSILIALKKVLYVFSLLNHANNNMNSRDNVS